MVSPISTNIYDEKTIITKSRIQAQGIQGEEKDHLSTTKATRKKIDVFREKIPHKKWKNYCLHTY